LYAEWVMPRKGRRGEVGEGVWQVFEVRVMDSRV
jgi:hypothetical protein